MRACVTDRVDQLRQLQAVSLENIARSLAAAVLDFSLPWRLQPVQIPKPWGQEIWYTGIEVRGVSRVVTDSGSTPLPWVLAFDQQRVLGDSRQLNLLKILDPLPDKVFGDLYFELHEHKREVYIVTHVDRAAWPDGKGAIRYGFSASKRAMFADDHAFVAAYRSAVQAYRHIRCEIDSQLDRLRERDGIGKTEPVSADVMRQWLATLPASLQQKEHDLREAMDSFTGLRELRVGDVLAVPLRTPHALQHGVRTVEFQTPVYERKILSFAQKVLTQDDWDTDLALQLARLQTPDDPVFPVLLDAGGVRIEEIVRFDDFTVQRLHLAPHARHVCVTGGDYLLLLAVNGVIDCAGLPLRAEQAVLVPACAGEVILANHGDAVVEVLLARPA